MVSRGVTSSIARLGWAAVSRAVALVVTALALVLAPGQGVARPLELGGATLAARATGTGSAVDIARPGHGPTAEARTDPTARAAPKRIADAPGSAGLPAPLVLVAAPDRELPWLFGEAPASLVPRAARHVLPPSRGPPRELRGRC